MTVYNNQLIAGGLFFDLAGYDIYESIAVWDGNTWQRIGGGLTDGFLYSATVYNDKLIAGGEFTIADGVDDDFIAVWDGDTWQVPGGGVYGTVFSLTVYEGELIAGGDLLTAGGEVSAYIARWGLPEVYKGDLNHDCRVGYSDLEWFIERWLDEGCLQTSWCYEADLNYDGVVDLLDYAELAAGWRNGNIPGDIDNDWEVDFADYALFANYWLAEDCNEPGWCGGADLNQTGQANIYDLSILMKYWLEKD